jgi:hypothetical protein
MELYQSLGRYQKPKGSKIKQFLKVMIILAVCVWLLYQIKHIEMKNYGGQTKIVVGYGTKLFGRKGILSRLDEGAFLDSGKVDSVGEVTNEYESNDDTEKEVHLKDMDEVESFHDENGVPPDSNDENISTFSNVNWLKKIDIYEVTYGVENDVEINLEGSINDTTADEEINTGITTHVDTSGSQSRNRWRHFGSMRL